jgi:hypothetical protein
MIDGDRLREFRQKISDPLLTILLVLLVLLLFVAVPLQAALGLEFGVFGFAVTLVMIAGILVLSGSWIVLAIGLLAVAAHIYVLLLHEWREASYARLYLVAGIWLTLSTTFAIAVARAVFAEGPVSHHRVVGGILLYLLLAMIFASLFLVVGASIPNAFAGLTIKDTQGLGSKIIYFSFVTLTSVGYGDIAPVHPFARSLCNLEAICGQLYPAILLARLVSLFMEDRR